MKYRVTKKHPAYKEGLEIINDDLILPDNDNWGDILPATCERWLICGWIEEIQEPEFTKDNMIEFAEQCIEQYRGGLYGTSTEFEKYVKTNNLKTK